MKLSALKRRDFIEAMLLIGLTSTLGSSRALAALQSGSRAHSADWLYAQLATLSNQLVAGKMTPEQYVAEGEKRLLDLEIEQDVLDDWQKMGPDIAGEGPNGYRMLHQLQLPANGRQSDMRVTLFYTPAGMSNPPHEHHNMMSVKRVLLGSYHVREYVRMRQVEPGVLAIRQITERPSVSFTENCVQMTDGGHSVHWFGATEKPVIAINISMGNAMAPENTFHGAGETRPSGRYFIDPTAQADKDGIIIAPCISDEQAIQFTGRRLSEFPSQIKNKKHNI